MKYSSKEHGEVLIELDTDTYWIAIKGDGTLLDPEQFDAEEISEINGLLNVEYVEHNMFDVLDYINYNGRKVNDQGND